MDIASYATTLFQDGRPSSLLRELIALRDIANDRCNNGAIRSLHGGQADFDGNLATVFAHCLGICKDDSSFPVRKDDRIRYGLHDSPKLVLGLLQSRQILKEDVEAISFPAFISAGNKVNLDISPPSLLVGEVPLKPGALA